MKSMCIKDVPSFPFPTPPIKRDLKNVSQLSELRIYGDWTKGPPNHPFFHQSLFLCFFSL